MKLSKYANSGGVCTAKQCKGVLLVQDVRTADKGILPVVQASAKKIGITFTVRTVSGAYPTIQTTARNVPISTRPRWGKDYADPSTFIDPLFVGSSIFATGNRNYALVGLKPSQAKQLGVKGSINNVPSIDRAATACAAKVGGPASYLLCGPGSRAVDANRALDPVHVGEPGQRHQLEGRHVVLRPERRSCGLCSRVLEAVRKTRS